MARKDAMLRLHSRLVARRDALRKALSGDMDGYREFAALNVVGDSVDAAIDTANDEISSQIVEIESRELGQIEHALERIVQGAYGRCEFCEGKIGEARLNALPYTSSCIECQRENERHGPAFGRDADDQRWAKAFDKSSSDPDRETHIKLSDFEMDLSEMGR